MKFNNLSIKDHSQHIDHNKNYVLILIQLKGFLAQIKKEKILIQQSDLNGLKKG